MTLAMAKPQWSEGRVLTDSACSVEQNYRLQKFRRHNRELHSWGVLCGLWVMPAADGSQPWGVSICPGFAIGPYGDEIELPRAAQVNVEDYLWFQPQQIYTAIAYIQPYAYVAVRYQDWLGDLELEPNAPCQCTEPVYREGRIVDGYQAGVIWTPPKAAIVPAMCQPESAECPTCPDSPWVVLARIALPKRGAPISAAMIDNDIRSTV
jgi:hypothetical protein